MSTTLPEVFFKNNVACQRHFWRVLLANINRQENITPNLIGGPLGFEPSPKWRYLPHNFPFLISQLISMEMSRVCVEHFHNRQTKSLNFLGQRVVQIEPKARIIWFF
jgi:hypothetical protein